MIHTQPSPALLRASVCLPQSAPSPVADLRVERGSARVDFARPVHAILGLPFDALTLDDAAARIRRSVIYRQRCFLSTPNVNFLVGTRRDDGFRQSVLHSDLSVVDGMPIVWWARHLGLPLRERVAGADLFEHLSRGEPGLPAVRVYFFGGPSGVAAAASEALASHGHGVVGVGGESPGFGPIASMDLETTAQRIDASGADFVLVALGAQKGQNWIEAMRSRLKAPVIAHLGAVVNFAARTVRRAPRWTQRLGLEWAWRIFEEPALWRRYATDGWALLGLLWSEGLPTWSYLRDARAARPVPARVRVIEHEGSGPVLHLGGGLLDHELHAMRTGLATLARSGRSMRVIVEADAVLGTAAMGLLLLLEGYARDLGCGLDVQVADARLQRVLRLNGLRFGDGPQSP